MKVAICQLKSASAYSQSRRHITPKLEKEKADDFERRTWREKMHIDQEGFMYIPPIQFKFCLEEVAKHLSQPTGNGKHTYTKHFKRGILITDGIVLPVKKEDVEPEWLPSMNPQGIRGGGRVVTKALPTIQSWEGELTVYILDEIITESVFEYHFSQAGMFIGIGTHRPGNGGYKGRFEIVKTTWDNGA